MRVLVTGANGFVGRNLIARLEAIQTGKDKNPEFKSLLPLEISCFDLGDSQEHLKSCCLKCDFVVHLAGVNRPTDGNFEGNVDTLANLLSSLKSAGNRSPVLLSSSIQASLVGRYENSDYGLSKLQAEKLLRRYAEENNIRIFIYRFPNIFGKWCRPNYNSAVATFCNAIANNEPYSVSDPSVTLQLLYIDDLVEEVLSALTGNEHRCEYDGIKALPKADGLFCYVKETDVVTVGELVELLESFKSKRMNLTVPRLENGAFIKKLYSTFLSYLKPDCFACSLESHVDSRGSFTEMLRLDDAGQISINVIKPEETKGQHWHNTKWERFLVVSGKGVVRQRRIGLDSDGTHFPVHEFYVCDSRLTAVDMIPGFTHSITNTSKTQNLVLVIWANEVFNSDRPDTFFEEVGQ